MDLNKKKQGIEIVKKGLVICYLGAGKGKTTAAMGMAARASGAGMNVYILQFVKARAPKKGGKAKTEVGEWPLSKEIDFFNEISIPRKMGSIETEQAGIGFVGILGDKKQKDQHIREALYGLERARQVIAGGDYQVVILDEIISAVELGLLTPQDVADIIKSKPENLHLVMTGHNKFEDIIKKCDLVTDMKMIKHPYYQGILAQEGIDY